MTIKYVRKFFGQEKYISEFTCYQKLHFCTPVTHKGGIIWCMIIHQNIRKYNFMRVYFQLLHWPLLTLNSLLAQL